MASVWSRSRARERIVALGEAGLDDRDLRRAVLGELRGVIGFGAYVWLLTDPVTEVGSAPLADVPCLPELPALVKSKYATAVNRWTQLRRQGLAAATLTAATGGDLTKSAVWRDVLSRYGIADVASAVFADQHGCWGFLDLWRDDAGGPFDADDTAFLAEVAASLARALRRCQARTFIETATAGRHDTGPVVLTLDEGLRIIGRTAASQAWLAVLLPPRPTEQAIPASVYNVAAQLLAAEAGIDDHPAYARTHLAGGFWLTLRAARLSSEAQPDAPAGAVPYVAVTIEEASAAARLDLFGRAFALTTREREL
ncbi:MAG: LuxR family transcriptional regulator, partial [Streptosporangiaceae bacterium]